jgi:hypothetical protein
MVVTSMHYLQPLQLYKTQKPFYVFFPVDRIPGGVQTNLEEDQRNDISVLDVRKATSPHTLDSSGFELVEYQSAVPYETFADPRRIEEEYFGEVERFLQEKLQATWVQVFDCDVGSVC